MESQFLIGRNLMVAPVLEFNVDERDVYFPGGSSTLWYEFQIDIVSGSVEVEGLKMYIPGWEYSISN